MVPDVFSERHRTNEDIAEAPGEEIGSPKLMVVAFSARYALEQLLDAFVSGLAGQTDRVMVPTHYAGSLAEPLLVRIDCGTSKLGGVKASLDPRSHLAIIRALRRHRPEVVHLLAGEGYPWAITLAWTLKRMGIPLVVTVHDPDPHPGNLIERLNAVLRRAVLHSASVLQLYSQQHLARVAELAPQARLEVIPHGSLASRFLAHREGGVARESLVLFFGRIEHYKGIDVLCRAALLLPEGLRLAIAGPGVLGEAEQALLAQLGARAEVHSGYQTDAQVARLMQRAAVVALPYRHVTQSSVPGIAAAFGVPIVASALGHFVEEVPALGGVLVPPEDPAALAQALREVAVRPRGPLVTPPTFEELAPQFVQLYRSLRDRTPMQRGPADAPASLGLAFGEK